MKEKIYTIPVNDAFSKDCECPFCILEKDLENSTVEFFLGPSNMECDFRLETNKKGFCRRHFEKLYKKAENKLGLSLMIETHIQHQMAIYRDLYKTNLLNKKKKQKNLTDNILKWLSELEASCAVCERMERITDRYMDVVLWMYFKDNDFRESFKNSKGICLRHYKLFLQYAKKNLSGGKLDSLTKDLIELTNRNMDRILEDVQWFSQKYDYQNKDAPWKNSKDAVPRGVEKFISYID